MKFRCTPQTAAAIKICADSLSKIRPCDAPRFYDELLNMGVIRKEKNNELSKYCFLIEGKALAQIYNKPLYEKMMEYESELLENN